MSAMSVQSSGFQDETFDTIVIGGGQAGLAVGYFLSQQRQNFIILDKYPRSGDSWRCRWDSLRLFTPSQFDSLPGLPYPHANNYFPTKDEIADYLETYARHFNLPVRHNTRVTSLSQSGQGFQVAAGDSILNAQNVVIATGPYQVPHIPALSSELDPSIFQLHSNAYHNPGQIPGKSVLVVGAGNSGAEIGLELVQAGRQVWLAGRDVGRIPANSPIGKILGRRLIWWLTTYVMTLDTPVGRKIHANLELGGTPLGRATREELARSGIELTPRLAAVREGKPQLEDGRPLTIDSIVWATGFRPDFHWVELPIFDAHGYPSHSRGIVPGVPGLYFVGMPFQTGLASSLLGGVGKDAADIAAQIGRNRN